MMKGCSAMSEKKVKVGVIGLGNMGSGHLSLISQIPEMELAACCDILPERAEKYGKQYAVPYFTDADELIKSGLVEAVTIAVPHYSHTPIAISALNHNQCAESQSSCADGKTCGSP